MKKYNFIRKNEKKWDFIYFISKKGLLCKISLQQKSGSKHANAEEMDDVFMMGDEVLPPKTEIGRILEMVLLQNYFSLISIDSF